MRLIIVYVIIVTRILAQNWGNSAEIFFLDGEIWQATIANGFAINSSGDRDPSLETGVARILDDSQWAGVATGFGYYDDGPNGNLDDLGHGLYKFSFTQNHYFFYDLRNCPEYMTGGTGSPDIAFTNLGLSFYFAEWGEENRCFFNFGDTIRLAWKYLPESIYSTNDITQFGNPTVYDCYETTIGLNMEYGMEILSGNFELLTENEIIPSGGTINLLRAEWTDFITQPSAVNNSQELVYFNKWDLDGESKLQQTSYLPDLPRTVKSIYKDKLSATIITTTSNGNIPISIQDPWYVDGSGNQDNEFHELNVQENPGGSYNVFLNEAEIYGDPNTALYAVSVPVEETIINGDRYLFDSWVVSGAEIAPYPGEESNKLKKKVLFTGNNPTIEAHYLNLSALEGDIYSRRSNIYPFRSKQPQQNILEWNIWKAG